MIREYIERSNSPGTCTLSQNFDEDPDGRMGKDAVPGVGGASSAIDEPHTGQVGKEPGGASFCVLMIISP